MANLEDRIKSLAFSSSIILFGRIFGKAANIAGLALLAKVLGQDDFGVIMLAFTITTVIGLMSNLGTSTGLAGLLPRSSGEKKGRVLVSGFLIATIGGCIGLILVVLFRGEISEITHQPRLAGILIPFAIFGFLLGISNTTVGVLRGYKLSTAASISRDLIAEGIALLFLFIWFLFWRGNIGVLIYWYLIPITTIVTGTLFIKRKQAIRFNVPSRRDLLEFFGFSWPLSFESSFVVLMANTDVILVGVFLAAGSVGIYKAAQPIALSVVVVLTAFIFLYLPIASELYAEGEIHQLQLFYKICTKWVLTFSIPAIVIIIGYSDTILAKVYSPAFSAGADVLSILALGMFFRTFFGPNGAMMKAISKTTVDLVAAASALVINIGLNIILIPSMGIEGAAIATVLGFLVFNALEVGVIYSSINMHPFSKDNSILVVAVVLVAVALRFVLDSSILSLFLFSISVSAISLITALLVSDQDVEQKLLRELTAGLSSRR